MRTGLRYISEVRNEGGLEIEAIEEHEDGEGVTFGGYILQWGDVAEIRDLFGEYTEEFKPGSFTKTIQERGPNGSRQIKMLRQHDQRIAQAGKFLSLYEDSKGLAFEGETIPTSVGKDVAVEIREGVMSAMSVGFDSVRDDHDAKRNHFAVEEARMWEASPVLWGAYSSGTIDNFRSLDVLVPALNRFLTVLEGGGELNEEQIGQLNMIRARISAILDEPRATTLVEDIQAQGESHQQNTRAGDDPHADQQSVVLARLRLAEIEGIAS